MQIDFVIHILSNLILLLWTVSSTGSPLKCFVNFFCLLLFRWSGWRAMSESESWNQKLFPLSHLTLIHWGNQSNFAPRSYLMKVRDFKKMYIYKTWYLRWPGLLEYVVSAGEVVTMLKWGRGGGVGGAGTGCGEGEGSRKSGNSSKFMLKRGHVLMF